MNKFTMVIWGLLIFSLWGVILLIAYKQRDTEYLEFENNMKKTVEVYIKKKKIDLKFNESTKIYIKDLIEEEYIKEDDENIKKYCVDSVVIYKGLLKTDYQLNMDCGSEEEL